MTALARLRERGDRAAVGEGFGILNAKKQPLTPGFAVPSPLGEGSYQLRPPESNRALQLYSTCAPAAQVSSKKW